MKPMWFVLTRGARRALRLRDERSIWPAPDGSDSELVVITEVDLTEVVVLSTPRVCRLHYEVDAIAATMILGAQPPAPWPDAARVGGRSFELMVTDRGPLVVPSQGESLPNRLASWLESVSENVRSVWPVPPDDCVAGTEWESTPSLPGGLPPHTQSATVNIKYRVNEVHNGYATVAIDFALRAVVRPPRATQPHTAEGRGELEVTLARQGGFHSAKRTGALQIVRPGAVRNQLVRSRMAVSARG